MLEGEDEPKGVRGMIGGISDLFLVTSPVEAWQAGCGARHALVVEEQRRFCCF